MGTLLSGRYGSAPEAESRSIPLQDCVRRLSLKPSDFVSEGDPAFFSEKFGARGRYLVFKTDPTEVQGSPIWRGGYYLLPLDAIDVLTAYEKKRGGSIDPSVKTLPVRLESKTPPPETIETRARAWAQQCQPLFFKCVCDHLELRLDPPWTLRRSWKARLRCPKRCQPVQTTTL